jgi:acylphosphatase
MKQVILKIYGDVQGVSFRWWAKNVADELELTGWVRNEPDGTVKVVAEGDEKVLKSFIDRCYTIADGTSNILNATFVASSVKVKKIDVEWRKTSGEFKEFSIRYKNFR